MQRDQTKPLVLATHTSIYNSWNEGVLDGVLTKSILLHGHTHGGQISAPIIFPLGLLRVDMQYMVIGQQEKLKMEITD